MVGAVLYYYYYYFLCCDKWDPFCLSTVLSLFSFLFSFFFFFFFLSFFLCGRRVCVWAYINAHQHMSARKERKKKKKKREEREGINIFFKKKKIKKRMVGKQHTLTSLSLTHLCVCLKESWGCETKGIKGIKEVMLLSLSLLQLKYKSSREREKYHHCFSPLFLSTPYRAYLWLIIFLITKNLRATKYIIIIIMIMYWLALTLSLTSFCGECVFFFPIVFQIWC